jgi:hypothetical protein
MKLYLIQVDESNVNVLSIETHVLDLRHSE